MNLKMYGFQVTNQQINILMKVGKNRYTKIILTYHNIIFIVL